MIVEITEDPYIVENYLLGPCFYRCYLPIASSNFNIIDKQSVDLVVNHKGRRVADH